MAGKRKERRRGDGSSSSYPRKERLRRDGSSSPYRSSSAGIFTQETPATRSSDILSMIEELTKDRRKQAEWTKQAFEELKEGINKIQRQLNKLIESEPNQMQPPTFSLKIKSKVGVTVERGESIKTDHGDSIVVDLYDGGNLIAPHHPLASAKVMIVVLEGKFNNSRCSWSKVDFEKSIKRPREGNSAIGDVNQGIQSIVNNCVFKLDGGTGRHSGATIWENSGNRKVKLGVMVLPDDSYGEERVLEGVSKESFLVRDPPRPSKKQKQKEAVDEFFRGRLPEQERNGPMPNPQYPTLNTQTAGNGQLQLQAYTNMPFIPSTSRDNTLGAYQQFSVEPSTNRQPPSFSAGHQPISMISDSTNQTMHNPDGGGQMDGSLGYLMDQPIRGPTGQNLEYTMRPVQLLWDRPAVEPSKRWNLLDQLMPLYSSQTKIHRGDFPTMRLMPEQGPYQRLFFNEQDLFLNKMMRDLQSTTIPKEVMQTHRNRGVLIQPLEPDDSDDEPPLKRKLHNKYQLRFVNKVCEAYYAWEQIKADDGNLLNVALYDENNAKVTSGPLSSASVEVVVLHGDFNATGQDYWTSEEFSSCVVCPQSTKEPPAIGGDRVLVLADGQASLGDAFFQQSSINARTGKFKMGVMLASTPDERVQEAISEPFWVWIRKGGRTGCTVFQRWHRAVNAIIFIWKLQSETYRTRSMRRPLLTMWHRAINTLIFISRLQSGTHRTGKMRRPLLSRDTGDACLELLKEQQCMQDRFGVQLPKAAVMKNVTLLDPRNKEEAAGQAQIMDEGTSLTYQLRFHGSLKARIYTNKSLLDQSDGRIEIAIYRDGQIITSGPLSSVRVEIVALESNHSCKGSWTVEDFGRQIQMRRGGQGSVLEGDRSVKLVSGKASLGNVWFSEGSSGTRSREFVLAARIDMSEEIGVRVEEAFMQPAITVLVERNEANAKSVLPMLNDKVYRLKEIAKNGVYSKRLEQHGISTVQDFLKALNKDEDELRQILEMKSKSWNVLVGHAKECDLRDEHKLKGYTVAVENVTLFFNCIHDNVGAEFNGRYIAKNKFDPLQKALVDRLKKKAYNELEVIDFQYVIKDNSPGKFSTNVNAGSSSIDFIYRDTGDACLELLKEQQCMQDSLLDAWTSGVEGFGVQLPKAAVMKNVTLLDPRNKGKGTPYHKMLKKGDIFNVKNEEYLPFADIKKNDNEDAASTPYHKMLKKGGIFNVKDEEYLPLADIKKNDNEDAASTPYHKMLKKGNIFNVKEEEYLPFANIKKNDNENAAEVAHDGNSGKEKGLENTHDASSISMQTLQFVPNIRSGSFADTGARSCMEDEHIRIDDLRARLGSQLVCPLPSALYGVFDGHGGPDAAAYMKKHATKFLFDDCDFPKASRVDETFLRSVEKSVRRALSQADLAMRKDISHSSGTTALIALVFGRRLLVANAGDSRAVLCRKGVAIEMSRVHGVPSVTRSLGDWGMKGSGGSAFPLISEPEFRQSALAGDDEFLILASGGLWEVMTSKSAVHVARRELCNHGDPERCARELVSEALRLGAAENLTVIVVCFFEELGSLQTPRPKRKITSPINPHGSKFPRIEEDKLHL